jgi:hypothetical protein
MPWFQVLSVEELKESLSELRRCAPFRRGLNEWIDITPQKMVTPYGT